MTPRATPDIVPHVGDHLRNHEAILAIGDVRVGTKTPADTDSPWIKITHYDGDRRTDPRHLAGKYLQLDCYCALGEGRPDAYALAATAAAALEEMTGTFDDLVVTAAYATGERHDLDDDLEPARDRYIVDCELVIHPAPGS